MDVVVMTKPHSRHHLGIRNDGDEQPIMDDSSDRCIGGVVQSVVAVEKADHRIGVEDYRHSSRSPWTRSLSSPPVAILPE